MYRMVLGTPLAFCTLTLIGCSTSPTEEKPTVEARLDQHDESLTTFGQSLANLDERDKIQHDETTKKLHVLAEDHVRVKGWTKHVLTSHAEKLGLTLPPLESAAADPSATETPSVVATPAIVDTDVTPSTITHGEEAILVEVRGLRQKLDKIHSDTTDIKNSIAGAVQLITGFQSSEAVKWEQLLNEAKSGKALLSKLTVEIPALREVIKQQGKLDRNYLQEVAQWLDICLNRRYGIVDNRPYYRDYTNESLRRGRPVPNDAAAPFCSR